MIDTGLRGRVAVVPGANHGIGAATARALAAEGARVLVTYLRLPLEEALARRAAAGEYDTPGEVRYAVQRAGSADAVVAAIRAAGGLAEAWEADLSDPAAIPTLFDHAEAVFGPVEVLVNNAAHWESDTFRPAELPRPPRSRCRGAGRSRSRRRATTGTSRSTAGPSP
jgi:3-oxoacyl-[acyl-carrier protein] reductase